MNRLLIFDFNLENKTAYTDDSSIINHAHTTLKLKQDQEVFLALANYGLATALVSEISEHAIAFTLTEIKSIPVPPYHLEVAASRPPTMKKILEHGSSLGVGQFNIFKGELSDKSYLQSHLFEDQNLKKYTSLGISQGKTLCHLPKVVVSAQKTPCDLKQKYILSLQSQKTFMSENIDFTAPISLLIGPERGFTINEERTWQDAGYTPITISERTLRVEIALFVALGQLEMLRLSR